MTTPSLIPLRDETVILPGAWTVERRPVDKPAVLPAVALAKLLERVG